MAHLAPASEPPRTEELIIPILGESWCITARTPPLSIFQGQKSEQGYRYQGASSDGFNISCFVEKQLNDTDGHEACFAHYWPKMKRNPLIDQNSIKITKTAKFTGVTYNTTADPPMHHANYYMSHEDRWVDIHISTLRSLPMQNILKTFENSLQFRPLAATAKQSRK